MADLRIPPPPSKAQIEKAAQLHTEMCECTALDGWIATFKRTNLESTGVWPADYDYGSLREINVPIEELPWDPADQEGSWNRQLGRSQLAVEQAVELRDFEMEQMREAIDGEEAA